MKPIFLNKKSISDSIHLDQDQTAQNVLPDLDIHLHQNVCEPRLAALGLVLYQTTKL